MIAIIDYDAGNTRSVMNALDRLDVSYVLTDDAEQLRAAEKVIFPGVGHAAAAMDALRRRNLTTVIRQLTQPVLGICVGMQLMCKRSEEGNIACLGIVDRCVRKFDVASGLKIPHMGWNTVHIEEDDVLWTDIADKSYFYFVHSYYVPLMQETIARCTYGEVFSAVIRKDNFWGIQCHAEKSGKIGSTLLANFVKGSIT